MATISYLRVSSASLDVINQRNAIEAAGFKVEREYKDEAVSGKVEASKRDGWAECFKYLREGDTLVVYAVDRLGRSVIDVLHTINTLNEKGVRLVILQQGFDTSTPAGKLALTMFAAFSEFETDIRKARQQEGIKTAQAAGKYQGRKPKLSADQVETLRARYAAGENRSALAREFGVDRVTVHRYCVS